MMPATSTHYLKNAAILFSFGSRLSPTVTGFMIGRLTTEIWCGSGITETMIVKEQTLDTLMTTIITAMFARYAQGLLVQIHCTSRWA